VVSLLRLGVGRIRSAGLEDLTDVEGNVEAHSGMPRDFVRWRPPAGGGDPPERARQVSENATPRVGIAFAFIRLDDSTAHRGSWRHPRRLSTHHAPPFPAQSRRGAADGADLLVLPGPCRAASRRARACRVPHVDARTRGHHRRSRRVSAVLGDVSSKPGSVHQGFAQMARGGLQQTK